MPNIIYNVLYLISVQNGTGHKILSKQLFM